MRVDFPRALFAAFVMGMLGSAIGAAESAVDRSLMPLQLVRAFPQLRFQRPVILAQAGDGSDRLFVGSQLGAIDMLPNRQDVTPAQLKTFLNITDQVEYSDQENEEGLLGLAFHPGFRKNHQFFIYYTTRAAPHTSIISRFRRSADDPDRADPDSEEELLRIEQPYWNHNGGTLAFGPDGYLYVGLGDGGKYNDPHMHGQNVQTLLGSILRIDVDRQEPGRKYAIPADNPFVGEPRYARGEIFAYGLRNVWRLSFDRLTGQLWAADVGQDTWEEINLVHAGGNYGWNLREARHKFGPAGAEPRADLIDPIWEYDHDVGKSITGGHVYRGSRLPALQGYYVYGDYVTGKVWALRYDPRQRRVVANRPVPGPNIAVVTFGEDEAGELFAADVFGMIYRFEEAR